MHDTFYIRDPEGRYLSEADSLAAARVACVTHEADGESLPLEIRLAGTRYSLETYIGNRKWQTSDLARRYA